MVGKTSLFTILTGVHEETRIGSHGGAHRRHQGAGRARWTRWPTSSSRPRSRTPRSNTWTCRPSPKKPARSQLPGQPARGRRLRPRAARCLTSDTVPHEKGSVDPLRDLEDVEMELILSDLVVVEKRLERLDKDRKKIKKSGARSRVRAARAVPRPRSKPTSRCASWSSTPTTRSAFAASSFSRRSRCSTC